MLAAILLEDYTGSLIVWTICCFLGWAWQAENLAAVKRWRWSCETSTSTDTERSIGAVVKDHHIRLVTCKDLHRLVAMLCVLYDRLFTLCFPSLTWPLLLLPASFHLLAPSRFFQDCCATGEGSFFLFAYCLFVKLMRPSLGARPLRTDLSQFISCNSYLWKSLITNWWTCACVGFLLRSFPLVA